MLTDKECRAATLDGGKAKLFDGNGLYLEILRSGQKSWRWKYRHGGKEKRLTFGLYPAVSLKSARIEREQAAAILRTGVDPAVGRRRAPQTQEEPTFQAVALDWHASQTKLFDPKHAKKVKRALENDVFPAIGALPISQVTSPQIVTLLRAIEARGSADVAHRARQRISDIFVYALASAIATSNPAAEMGKALELPPSEWSIDYDSLDQGRDDECLRRSTSPRRSSASCVKWKLCWVRVGRPPRHAGVSRSASRPTIAGARNMAA